MILDKEKLDIFVCLCHICACWYCDKKHCLSVDRLVFQADYRGGSLYCWAVLLHPDYFIRYRYMYFSRIILHYFVRSSWPLLLFVDIDNTFGFVVKIRKKHLLPVQVLRAPSLGAALPRSFFTPLSWLLFLFRRGLQRMEDLKFV